MNVIIIIITIFTAVKQDSLRSDGLEKMHKNYKIMSVYYYRNAYDIETRSYVCLKYGL